MGRLRRELRADGFVYVIGPEGDILDKIAPGFAPSFSTPQSELARQRRRPGRRRGKVRRERLIAFQDGRCFYCSQSISNGAAEPKHCATTDEVIPITLGGTQTITNQVAACLVCNGLKGGRAPTADELSRLAVRNGLMGQADEGQTSTAIADEIEDMVLYEEE